MFFEVLVFTSVILISLSRSPLVSSLTALTLSAILGVLSCCYVWTSPVTLLFLLTLLWSVVVILVGLTGRGPTRVESLSLSLTVIFASATLMLSSTNLVGLVISFEIMLIGALVLLRQTAKTERVLEALKEMYLWGVLGSFFLIASVIVCGNPALGVMGLNQGKLRGHLGVFMGILGFGIKIPLWPFASWLVRAHVEASTEFSIMLSGVLVKFGVIGLFRFIELSSPASGLLYILMGWSVIGVLDASSRLFVQVDLKRIVALTTVIETNWLVLSLALNSSTGDLIGFMLIPTHALTTTLEFGVVELLYRRFGSRSLSVLRGVHSLYPNLGKLCWAIALTTIGLPGTGIFSLKLIFLVELFSIGIGFTVVVSLVFLVLMPIFFIRLWLFILGGVSTDSQKGSDISIVESCALLAAMLWVLVLGFNPNVFV